MFVGNSVSAAGACVGSSACVVAGGAVYADASSTLLSVMNCTFKGNTVTSTAAAVVYGGAVAALNESGAVNVNRSTFIDNHALASASPRGCAGGALYTGKCGASYYEQLRDGKFYHLWRYPISQ